MAQRKQTTSRAEEVRERRAKRPRSHAFDSGVWQRRKASTPSQPPVVVRGGVMGVSSQRSRRAKRAKRRFDVALNTPGAEVRLPSLPAVRIGWRLVSGLLVGILVFSLYTIWNSPVYRVQAVEVEGLQRLTASDINAVSNVAGKPIFLVDPDRIKDDLRAAFLELSDVTVEMGIPATFRVVVIERQPVLAWWQDGQILWVDAAGVAFPQRGENGPAVMVKAEDSPPAPAAATDTGMKEYLPPNRFLPPQLVTAILAMSVQAPEGIPLLYTNTHGLGWKDKGGWEVYFGRNLEDIQMKLSVYKAIVKRLEKEDIQPALISVEYVHAPYYRLEP